MATTTIRPGLLVALSARISGGVVYDRKDLDPNAAATYAPEDAAVSRWETTKIIDDPEEYERAVKIRGKCRGLVASVCAPSDFGLLCPSSREFDLQTAIEEAKRIAAEHNASARRSFVSIYVLTGRVAQDDAEAVRAISAEVRGLLDTMKTGITAADPTAIREAANKAKRLGAMLTPEAGAKVESAIEAARKAAREIVRRVEKSGEVAAAVVSEIRCDEIETARFAFLDLDAAKPVEELPVAAPTLDLAPEPEAKPAASIDAPAFEFFTES